VSEEYIKLYPVPLVNTQPVLTFECTVGRERCQQCTGETYWGGKCSCACHLPATSRRAKVE